MSRLVDADELMWRKSSLVEPRDKAVSMGKPFSDDEVYAYRLGWNDAIDAIMEYAPTVDVDSLNAKHEDIGYEKGFRDGYAEALEETDNVPDTNVGKWINISISANGNESSAECDLCGAIVHNNFSSIINYCPNCGARMEV